MVVIKEFTQLTKEEKAQILHTLFLSDMKELVLYLQEYAGYILGDKEQFEAFTDKHQEFPPTKWAELIPIISQYISTHFIRFTVDPAFFAEAFTRGYNSYFFLEAIREFTKECENENLINGIVFLFGMYDNKI